MQISMSTWQRSVCGHTIMRSPTGVRARVDLEVLGACEHLAAVGECA